MGGIRTSGRNRLNYDFGEEDAFDCVDELFLKKPKNGPKNAEKSGTFLKPRRDVMDLDLKIEDPNDSEDEGCDERDDDDGILKWGKDRSAYHKLDEESDNESEDYGRVEEAGLIQRQRVAKQCEEDYGDYYAFRPGKSESSTKIQSSNGMEKVDIMVQNDLSVLSKEQKLDLLVRDCPEILLLVESFKHTIDELNTRLEPMMRFIRLNKPKPCSGTRYIEIRHQLLLNYCTNLCFYFFLKMRGDDEFGDHPVLRHLAKMRRLIGKLKVIDDSLKPQFDKVLEFVEDLQLDGIAAMKGDGNEGVLKDGDELVRIDDVESDLDDDFRSGIGSEDELLLFEIKTTRPSGDSISREKLRDSDFCTLEENSTRSSIRKSTKRAEHVENKSGHSQMSIDMGDEDDDKDYEILKRQVSSNKKKSSILSSCEYRNMGTEHPLGKDLDTIMQSAMGENALDLDIDGRECKESPPEIGNAGEKAYVAGGLRGTCGGGDGQGISMKKRKPQVAFEVDKNAVFEHKDPILTRRESKILEKVKSERLFAISQTLPSDGKRKLSKTILDNRGLRRHTPKDKKNSRTRKKRQYRKALIKLKSIVPNMRDQEKPYTGEHTGININVVKAIKLS